MFSVVKNYLGNLRELDFGQMESHFTVDLFVKTLALTVQLTERAARLCRARYNKIGKSLVNLPIV